jgi:hypothetical protein
MRLTVNKTVQQPLLIMHKPTTVASNSNLPTELMLRVQELAPKQTHLPHISKFSEMGF